MIPVFHYTWGKKASNNHKNKQTKNKQLVAKYKLNVQKKTGRGQENYNVTVEPRYNEGPKDCHIKVLFHIILFYFYWGKEIVCYTEDFIISRLHCIIVADENQPYV